MEINDTSPKPFFVWWIDIDSFNIVSPETLCDRHEAIESSILSLGWVSPLVVDKNNNIIDGHNRIRVVKNSQALRNKFDSKVPCIVLDLSEEELASLCNTSIK